MINDDYGGLGPAWKEAFLLTGHGRSHDTEPRGFKQHLRPGH